MVTADSTAPLHHQLTATLRDEIQSGKFQHGDRFATERELIERFGVSCTTVRRALNALVDDGYLVRKVSKGTFVRRPCIEESLSQFSGFLDGMEELGIPASVEAIDSHLRRAEPKIARALSIAEDSNVYWMRSLGRAAGEPVLVNDAWWPEDLGAIIVRRAREGAVVSRVLEELRVPTQEAESKIRAAGAMAEEARLLGVRPGSPVLVIERVFYTAEGRPSGVARLVYKGEAYDFRIRQVRRLPRRLGG